MMNALNESLSAEQKAEIRERLMIYAVKLLDIPYEFGALWKDVDKPPETLDCSEMVKGVYRHFLLKMPDGSQNQFDFTVSAATPQDADLAFFGREANPKMIYHVGLVYGDHILEARGYQPNSSFKTGRVILRPKTAWIHYKNFCGFRAHPKLL